MSDDDVRAQLVAREPLFHQREFVYSAASFDACTAEDFWEIGASGARYDRADVRRTILDRLATQPRDQADVEGWQMTDVSVRHLGPDTYLMTYQLDQLGRVTRRSTVWRRTQAEPDPWVILYHQGTLVRQA